MSIETIVTHLADALLDHDAYVSDEQVAQDIWQDHKIISKGMSDRIAYLEEIAEAAAALIAELIQTDEAPEYQITEADLAWETEARQAAEDEQAEHDAAERDYEAGRWAS